MQSVWGKLVEMEPQDHLGYSNDYRPDLTARGLGAGGKRLVGDVKFKDPLSSNPEDIKRRGCFVGFGCTDHRAGHARCHVRPGAAWGEGRRRLSARRWRRLRGAEEGGLQPPAVSRRLGLADAALRDLRWLERARGAFVQQDAGHKVRDKLSKKQYDDEVSWTTRTWSSLMAQRMSVALHMAAAWEIARELSLAGAEDEAALFGGGVADSVA